MFFRKSLEDRVDKAKSDRDEMNRLIDEYKPFIASTVQKRTGRFQRYGHDDELTIGMMAFKEAIDSYDRNKGKFLSFAKQVINLRLIDYYRKHEKEKRVVYLDISDDNEDEANHDLGSTKAIANYKDREENEIRKLEINEYKKELSSWGIDFSELVKVSPKQDKVRDLYKQVARIIVENEHILDSLIATKRLPIKEIEKIIPVHRKKIERGRIYIISMVIVLKGDYEFIREYIDWR